MTIENDFVRKEKLHTKDNDNIFSLGLDDTQRIVRDLNAKVFDFPFSECPQKKMTIEY